MLNCAILYCNGGRIGLQGFNCCVIIKELEMNKGSISMAIKSIKLENFTVFKNIELTLSPGVNVFIGENGTGKTHLLKALYAASDSLSYTTMDQDSDSLYFSLSLRTCFGIVMPEELMMKLSIKEDQDETTLIVLADNGRCEHRYGPSTGVTMADRCPSDDLVNFTPIFIPAKDMLTHARGLLSMAAKHSKDMPFDKTLLDLIKKAEGWKVNDIPDIAKNIIPLLEEVIGGTILQEDGDFYVVKPNGDKIPFSCEAEGVKKFGLLWQLLMLENITKDTILFWDEPEANINPKLIPLIVKILLELARQGVQIFIASHDYFFPQYSEVFAQEADAVVFHSLYKTEEGVQCETNSQFSNLTHNSIIDEKINLYDEKIKKVLR